MQDAKELRIKVSVRRKPISNGRHTLYLDFWPPIARPETGKATRREFLRLYTIDDPRNRYDRKHNAEMMNMAQVIRNRRVYELNIKDIDPDFKPVKHAAEALNQDFLAYFRALAEERKGKDRGIWISALRYLKKFAGGYIPFAELNEQKIAEFKDYLESRYLAQNTKATYFLRLRTALKQAFRDGILEEDLNANITGIKEEKTSRVYLTLEELNRLAKTPCSNDELRRAGLFSALTGLKFIELQKLIWLEVREKGDKCFLKIQQKKSDEPEKHPISKQAFELLGPRRTPLETVFHDLHNSVYNTTDLADWLKDAGIDKKMSFSGFRHSYAINQLFLGTDIYTLSKMLRHVDVKSTLVYAGMVNELKNSAANRMTLDL